MASDYTKDAAGAVLALAKLNAAEKEHTRLISEKTIAEKGSNQTAALAVGAVAGFKVAMGTTTNAIGSIKKAIGAVGQVAGLATGGIGAMTSLLGGITGSLMAPIEAIQGMVESIIGFVQLANPGVVLQFTLAMNDAMAVMGQMLTPVLQGITIYVRAFGDVLARLEPVLQPLFDTIAQYIVTVGTGWAGVLESAAPLIQLMADGLIPVINATARGMAFLQGVLMEIINTISQVFGLESRKNAGASSRGAAVRQTQVQSVDAFASSLFAKSLQGAFGGGNGKAPQEHIPDIAAMIRSGQQVVQDIAGNIKVIVDWLVRRQQDVKDIQSIPGKAIDAAASSGGLGLLGILGKSFIK